MRRPVLRLSARFAHLRALLTFVPALLNSTSRCPRALDKLAASPARKALAYCQGRTFLAVSAHRLIPGNL